MVALGTLGFSFLVLMLVDNLYYSDADHLNFIRTGYLKYVIIGRRLTDSFINRIPGIDLRNCTRECSICKRCRSINFLSRFPLCELNFRTIAGYGAVVVNVSDTVYSQKSFWKKEENMQRSSNEMTSFDLCVRHKKGTHM